MRRDSPDKQIQFFHLNSVRNWAAAATYMTTKPSNQETIYEGHNYPKAKSIVLRNFYVNAVLIGVGNSEEDAALLCELHKMLYNVKMTHWLHKWPINEPSLIKDAGLEIKLMHYAQYSGQYGHKGSRSDMISW